MRSQWQISVAPLHAAGMVSELEPDWDWPIAECESLAAYVEMAASDPSSVFFWLIQDHSPVGFLELSGHPDLRQFQTATFLRRSVRGTGLNQVLKHTVSAAMNTLDLGIVATVRDDNLRSLLALRKVTGADGEPYFEKYRESASTVFDLSTLKTDPQWVNMTLLRGILERTPEIVAAHRDTVLTGLSGSPEKLQL